jgi:transcription elongation factor Elf1
MGRAKHGKRPSERYAAYKRYAARRGVREPFKCPRCYKYELTIRKVRDHKGIVELAILCNCGLRDTFRMYSSKLYEKIDYYNFYLDSMRKLGEGSVGQSNPEAIKTYLEDPSRTYPLRLSTVADSCNASIGETFEYLRGSTGYMPVYGKGGEWLVAKVEEKVPVTQKPSVEPKKVVEPTIVEAPLKSCLFKFSSGKAHMKIGDKPVMKLSGRSLRRLQRRMKVDLSSKNTMSEEEFTKLVSSRILASDKVIQFTIVGDVIRDLRIAKKSK